LDRACRTYGGEESYIQGIGRETRGKDSLEHLYVDRRTLLKWLFKKWDGGMGWIDLVQDRYICQAHLKAVMNLQIPQNAGNFVASWGPVHFSRRTLLH
jgi:hypothetical protein